METKAKTAGEFWRFVKFALFSVSAGLIETGMFYLLDLIPGFGYWACYLPALAASIVWNFTFNRRFTFQSATNVPRAMLKVFAFYAVFTPLSTILGDWIVDGLYGGADLVKNIVFAATLLLNFATEFPYQRFYVFRGAIDDREYSKEESANAPPDC